MYRAKLLAAAVGLTLSAVAAQALPSSGSSNKSVAFGECVLNAGFFGQIETAFVFIRGTTQGSPTAAADDSSFSNGNLDTFWDGSVTETYLTACLANQAFGTVVPGSLTQAGASGLYADQQDMFVEFTIANVDGDGKTYTYEARITGAGVASATKTEVVVATDDPGEQTSSFLGDTGGSLLSLQPDLRTRVGGDGGGVGRFNAQVTQGFGFVDFDTGGGPVWMTLQAERRESNGQETFSGLAALGMQWDTGRDSAAGVMLQFDTGRGETGAGGETQAQGFLAGPYIVQQFGGLTFDGRLMAGRAMTDVTVAGGAAANGVGGSRVLGTAQLSGSHDFANGHTFRPRSSVAFARQTLDAFSVGGAAVAAQEQTLGEAILGGDWDIPLNMGTGLTSLTLGGGAHYAFQQTGGTAQLPDAVRGRVDLSVNFQSESGLFNTNVGVYTDGLGADTYSAQGATLTLNYQF